MDMAIVVILFILGSMIFDKKKKRSGQDDQDSYDTYENSENPGQFNKPTGRPMTWEDMEREYGIKIEHESGQSPKQPNYDMTENYEVLPSNTEQAERERLESIERERVERKRLEQQRQEAQGKKERALRKAEEARKTEILALQAQLQKVAQKQCSVESTSRTNVAAFQPLSMQPGLDKSQLRQAIAWSIILEKPKALQHNRVR